MEDPTLIGDMMDVDDDSRLHAPPVPPAEALSAEYERLQRCFPYLKPVEESPACWTLAGQSPVNLDLTVTLSLAGVDASRLVAEGMNSFNEFLGAKSQQLMQLYAQRIALLAAAAADPEGNLERVTAMLERVSRLLQPRWALMVGSLPIGTWLSVTAQPVHDKIAALSKHLQRDDEPFLMDDDPIDIPDDRLPGHKQFHRRMD